jgi:MFS family permease
VLRSARLSVGLVFLIHGIVTANWLSRIPAVQNTLRLSNAILGFTLLAASAGAGIAMLGISPLISRFGSAALARWSSIGFCLALPLPAMATSAVTLAGALLVYGSFAGSMDVAMNTQAVDVERAYQRPVMVGFHAMFSLGGLIGAAAGGIAAAQHIAPLRHLSMAAVPLLLIALLVARGLLADAPVGGDPAGTRILPRLSPRLMRALLALGALSFCVLIGEGAMSDWSAVYLAQFAGQGTAAAGYAVFSLAMALGRFAGDRLRGRIGSVWLVRVGSLLAACGLAGGLGLGGVWPAMIGFACAGVGFSSIFPIALSAAGLRTMPNPQAGVTIVTAVGYAAFLAGPPAIGLLSAWLTLRGALGLIVALSLVCASLAGFVREAE